MEEELLKQMEELNKTLATPHHKDKLAIMLAQMGKLLLTINPKAKEIIEKKAKLN